MPTSKPPAPITEVEQIEEEIDPHLVEVDDYDPGGGTERSESLTTTASLHREHQLHVTETVDQIIDLGVEILDPEAETHIVRVHTDVGPVFYGGTERPIELKKNRRYSVPASIYRYLYERGLLVDQLADTQI
jgi:hypothetical protein